MSVLKNAWAGAVVRAEVAAAPSAAKNTARVGAFLRVPFRERGAPGLPSASETGDKAIGVIAKKLIKVKDLIFIIAGLGDF